MKKITIALMLVLLLVGTISAVYIGQNITQQQLDNVNVQSQDLEEHFLRDESNNVIYDCNGGICRVYISYLTITPNETSGGYSVVEETKDIPFNKKRFRKIKQETNLSYAKEQLRDYLITRKNKIVDKAKEEIEEYQSQSDIDDIISELDI